MFPCWWLVNDWDSFTELHLFILSFSKSFKFFQRSSLSKVWVFPKLIFFQSSSLSKVQVCPKFKFVQSSELSKVQVFPKFKFVQSFSSFKIMDFLKCSRASQWHCVPGCILCKRVSPKRNAPKNILKNPLFKVHYGFKFQVFQKFKFFPKFKFVQSYGFKFFKVEVFHS